MYVSDNDVGIVKVGRFIIDWFVVMLGLVRWFVWRRCVCKYI